MVKACYVATGQVPTFPSLQHADVVQPLLDLPRPVRGYRIGRQPHPEGMAALSVDTHIDRHACVVQRQGISHRVSDIVDRVVHGVDQERWRRFRADDLAVPG